MVNVRSRHRKNDDRTTRPCFNVTGSKTMMGCKVYSEDGIVNARKKRSACDTLPDSPPRVSSSNVAAAPSTEKRRDISGDCVIVQSNRMRFGLDCNISMSCGSDGRLVEGVGVPFSGMTPSQNAPANPSSCDSSRGHGNDTNVSTARRRGIAGILPMLTKGHTLVLAEPIKTESEITSL